MDTDICGLNKVVCKATESKYNSYYVTISNGSNSQTKQMSSGTCTFLIPSMPAPAKQSYTATLRATQSGSSVYQAQFELGFGDSTVVYLGASSTYIHEKDSIFVGTGLSMSRTGELSTISHPTSGVTSGSYGQSYIATLGHGSSFTVPYINVDSRGHITSASNRSVTLPSLSTTTSVTSGSSSLITSGAVYSALGGSSISKTSSVSNSNDLISAKGVYNALGKYDSVYQYMHSKTRHGYASTSVTILSTERVATGKIVLDDVWNNDTVRYMGCATSDSLVVNTGYISYEEDQPVFNFKVAKLYDTGGSRYGEIYVYYTYLVS